MSSSRSKKRSRLPVTPSRPPACTVLQDTPVHNTISSHVAFTSTHYRRQTKLKQLEAETRGVFTGPLEPERFIDYFLPSKRRTRQPRTEKKNFEKVASQTKEVEMYSLMVEALKPLCPKFDLVDTHRHEDNDLSPDIPAIKPDICVYESKRRTDTSTVTDMSQVDVHIKVKLAPEDDPFRDDGVFEHKSEQSCCISRGQIVAYVTRQLAKQFRTHAFSVFICKDRARLIYWDRSGAVVTRSFSYLDEPWLETFFWRYTKSSPEVRGIDTTVTMPDADSADVEEARACLGLDDTVAILKFAIYDEQEKNVSYCFGGNIPLVANNLSPTGRATRVFVVYDPVLKKRVIMKDTWRISLPDMQTEGQTYRRLNQAEVSHVPILLHGGDVKSDFSVTRSYDFADEFSLQLRPHTHYRLTLDGFGKHLTSFETIKEFVGAVADALQAHTEAYDKTNILHRDISVGNILIGDSGGLLIDWDFSKDVDMLGASRQPFRTGTWQFIAARLLLAGGPTPHDREDDLESFFHVLSWVALRYTRHKLNESELATVLREVYDSSYIHRGRVYGGRSKVSSLQSEFAASSPKFDSAPLQELIIDLSNVLRVRYDVAPTIAQEEQFDLLKQALRTSNLSDVDIGRYSELYPVVQQYRDRGANLNATWIQERLRTAMKSEKGMAARRVSNLVTHPDEISQLEYSDLDMPRPSKRLKPDASGDELEVVGNKDVLSDSGSLDGRD